jgi:hypothetical protein
MSYDPLNEEDLKHCHKVLSSDIKECELLMEGGPTDRVARLMNRIDDDNRVLARIEKLIGYVPEWKSVVETESEELDNGN